MRCSLPIKTKIEYKNLIKNRLELAAMGENQGVLPRGFKWQPSIYSLYGNTVRTPRIVLINELHRQDVTIQEAPVPCSVKRKQQAASGLNK